MIEIALLSAADVASDATDRRPDAYLFDRQLEVLRKGFAAHGIGIEPVGWADRNSNMEGFDAVIVACAWDYQERWQEFLAHIDALALAGLPVFNDPKLVRWNIEKTYLRDFEARGVPVIPTLWPDQATAEDIAAAMTEFGVKDVVLKRQVGGGARGQLRFTWPNLPANLPADLSGGGPLLDRPGMIQPFIASVTTEGEYAFLFVDGEFSHAVVKRNATGDYRIQEAYGGRSHRIDPGPADLRHAQAVLDALDEPPLYARVDMVRGPEGGLLLMELEVIEPYLFASDGPAIGEMLGRALKKRLR